MLVWVLVLTPDEVGVDLTDLPTLRIAVWVPTGEDVWLINLPYQVAHLLNGGDDLDGGWEGMKYRALVAKVGAAMSESRDAVLKVA